MQMLKRLLVVLVFGAASYGAGTVVGMTLINAFSTNTHDKSVEAAMTGAFVFGPIAGFIGSVAAAIWYARRAVRKAARVAGGVSTRSESDLA